MPENRFKALFQRALRAQKEEDLEEALRIWRGILVIQPDYIPALNNMGIALRRLGRIAESEAVLRTGLERAPHSAELWTSLGQTLSHWGVAEEAVTAVRKALALDPQSAPAHFALGQILDQGGDPMGAMASYQMAADADPTHAPALSALADGWRERGQVEQAERLYRQAADLPDAPAEARYKLAMSLLAQGKVAEGWPLFEARLEIPELAPETPDIPRWDGSPLAGRQLLVRHEQGLSESLQFCRLMKKIEGGEVIFDGPPELVEMVGASRCADRVLHFGEPQPKADCWIPLLSLPLVLGLEEANPPVAPPYLRPDPTRLAPWRRRLGEELYIGLAWRGGELPMEHRQRGFPLAAAAPLAELPGVTLFSLQKGAGAEDIRDCGFPIFNMIDEIDEDGAFLDTAAVMETIPLTITADTAIAHLAGALGRPVWVAAPACGDWRLGTTGSDSPWYPSMEIFHEDSDGGWHAVFARMAEQLQSLMGRS